MAAQTATLFIALFILFSYITQRGRKKVSYGVNKLPGPGRAPWLIGHMPVLMRPEQSGDADFLWTRLFGYAVHIKGPFGRDVLFISDPKVIQHVLNTPRYKFPKSPDTRFRIRLVAGKGIAWADGEQHTRQRKVMNPAFSPSAIRDFLPIIQDTSRIAVSKWQDIIAQGLENATVLDVYGWLSRLTLDSLGGALDYDFEALTGNSHNELTKAYKNLLSAAHYKPSNFSIAFREICGYLPEWMIGVLQSIPSKKTKLLMEYTEAAENVSRKLVDRQLESIAAGQPGGRDIMSLLVKANQSQDLNGKVAYSELVAQLTTLLVAGHETLANTIGWTLYELSKRPEIQRQLRSEISAVRLVAAQSGCHELASIDYDSMTLLSAVIKETLRFHPALPLTSRIASEDDVLPLWVPTTTNSGKIINKIPVQKGQRITISFAAYHRLTSLWGDDAEIWNPSRFLNPIEPSSGDKISMGMFSNLLTFSSGERSCIGWRFAMLSIHVILFELLEKFEFSPPPGNVKVFRAAAGVITPMIKDGSSVRVELPLTVTSVA
ncbi:hypothetical protein M422DRAFT_30822 [Sphaerobolus stellatus SS14]|uniref:Unplaced genomic scaffold SPHSTscaffold_47, whole genome shotgun sequence n=1 Tax=Sphaerobolus stellatus (strain SS14) TaxID=990650 RepID=A0A0C9VYK0_SPHS4|nr:hypothetical protein M422DRAFT_30822 [Sphaerobolus stellatus SS14]